MLRSHWHFFSYPVHGDPENQVIHWVTFKLKDYVAMHGHWEGHGSWSETVRNIDEINHMMSCIALLLGE